MYYNNQDVRLEEMPKPKIGEDEFLLEVKACGICGSDLMEWYRVKKAPLVLGHEATGQIVEVGKKVTRFKKGDRVFVSHHVPCNTCLYCLQGNHTVCETLHTTNFYPGGFSQYVRVPWLNVASGTFLLPDEISYEEGTFIEPLACIVRGQRMVNLKAKQSVLILGSGISGLLHLALAKAKGAGRIVVTDVNEFRLNKAKELGADSVINAAQGSIVSIIKEAFDLVIICTSALVAFQDALRLVDRAGTILCFAPTEPGLTLAVPVNEFWRKNIKLCIPTEEVLWI